jgi:hypothetical protein
VRAQRLETARETLDKLIKSTVDSFSTFTVDEVRLLSSGKIDETLKKLQEKGSA